MGRRMVIASMAAAGLVALVCLFDLAFGFPFGNFSVLMDVLYLLSAGIIAYMGFETYQEQR